MNAISPPRRSSASKPAPAARVAAENITLARVHKTGESVDLAWMRIWFMGMRFDCWLDCDGRVTAPRGVGIDMVDLAEIEACAHAAVIEELVNRFAAQRERRRIQVTGINNNADKASHA